MTERKPLASVFFVLTIPMLGNLRKNSPLQAERYFSTRLNRVSAYPFFLLSELIKGGHMKAFPALLLVAATLTSLAGCSHQSSAIKEDGRPHAPSGQSSPGGTLGSGPVGQPQS